MRDRKQERAAKGKRYTFAGKFWIVRQVSEFTVWASETDADGNLVWGVDRGHDRAAFFATAAEL